METLAQIAGRISAAIPGARVTIVPNPALPAQSALLLDHESAVNVARFLHNDLALRLDYCSNVTGIDWPKPGHLEVVYHLYSMALRHGPLVLRARTGNRADLVSLPSLTPVWRSCEFQEREVFDLYGVVFEGHPDLRRLLMWDEFKDFPMRKDYVEPPDYEWEPTAHDAVAAKAALQHPAAAAPSPAPSPEKT